MKTELTPTPTPRKSAFDLLAGILNIDRASLVALLKKTICPKAATDEEIAAFAMVAGKYGLDPFLKQIYAFPNKGGGVTPIVGIDGWLAIINRQPGFDGMDVDMAEDGSAATCSIFIKGRAHPVKITEYLDECKRNTEPWRTCPRRMLRHKAIIQAARVAFNISGIYDEDEGRDIAEGSAQGMREARGRVMEANPFEQCVATTPKEAPTAEQKQETAPAQPQPLEYEEGGEDDFIPGLEPIENEDFTPEAYRD